MELEQLTQDAADEIFQEEAEKVWDEDGADELSATPVEPQEQPAEEAVEITKTEESPPPDEWAGVPEIVKNRLIAAEAEIAKREHAIKSQMGRELAEVRRQLAEANSKLTPKAAETPPEMEKWSELKQDYEPIAGAVEEFVSHALKGAQGAVVDIAAIKAEVKAEVKAENAVEFVESFHEGWLNTIETPEFLAWKKTQDPKFQVLYESDRPRDAIKVLDKFKADQASAEKVRKAAAERDARLKQSTTVRGQGTGVLTDEQTLSADQIWDIEAKKIWQASA